MQKIAIFLLVLSLVTVPALAFAQLVPNCDTNCGWDDLIVLAKNILNFMITISIFVAALMFAYAGWLFFSDSGNSSNVAQGKKVFAAVVIGLVIVLTAWLVVNTILDVLTGRGLDQRSNEAVLNDSGVRP